MPCLQESLGYWLLEGGVAWNAGGTCWLVVGSLGGVLTGFVGRILTRIHTPVSRICHLLIYA